MLVTWETQTGIDLLRAHVLACDYVQVDERTWLEDVLRRMLTFRKASIYSAEESLYSAVFVCCNKHFYLYLHRTINIL